MTRLDKEKDLVARDFDAIYYAAEYPDILLPPHALLDHFCTSGWREGRNPNAYFDTVSYLLVNDDVADAGVNPFYHFLAYGMTERRHSVPAATPSVRTQLLFGYSIVDWVARIRPHIDEAFYRASLPPGLTKQIDLAAHFAYRGWQEGMSPNREFEVRHWISHYPDTKRFLVNPLLLRLEQERGAFRSAQREAGPVPASPARAEPASSVSPVAVQIGAPASDQRSNSLTDAQIELIRTEFSPAYYLSHNPDVDVAKIDPLLHYVMAGWREGRNPNKQFDTSYYISSNEDVVAAGLHPFWHYLAEGRKEGRRPCRPGGHRRQTIDAARPPERRTETYVPPDDEQRFTAAEAQTVRSALAQAKQGAVISLSHDCYVNSIGGTQIFISDEQQKFARAGYAYLHLSPMVPRLALAPDGPDFNVRVVLDGIFVGAGPISDIFPLLSTISAGNKRTSLLVVHSLLGFNRTVLADLHAALKPNESIYWLHDYSSICAGFNLLRNDVEFCNAPPPDSMACRVCVCGPGRPNHLGEMQRIFEQCRFTVLAPSQYALDLWLAKSSLLHVDARVHRHWDLAERKSAHEKRPRRAAGKRVTVAFVGFPLPSKGWPAFVSLVERHKGDERYRFLHFVAPGTVSLAEIEIIPTEVTSSNRTATVTLLRQNAVDIVLVLSTWPETFSFVAHEALVAGAAIVCLADSGNVAALVQQTGRGFVVKDETALLAYFEDGDAQSLVHDLWKRRLPDLDIVDAGTSATGLNSLCAPL